MGQYFANKLFQLGLLIIRLNITIEHSLQSVGQKIICKHGMLDKSGFQCGYVHLLSHR